MISPEKIKEAVKQHGEWMNARISGRQPFNDGHTHEALHATYVLMETFSEHVIETRACEEFPEAYELAEKAHTALFDLYQYLGSKMVTEDEIQAAHTQGLEDAARVLDYMPMGYSHPDGSVTEKELANARLKYAAAIRSLKPNEGKG